MSGTRTRDTGQGRRAEGHTDDALGCERGGTNAEECASTRIVAAESRQSGPPEAEEGAERAPATHEHRPDRPETHQSWPNASDGGDDRSVAKTRRRTRDFSSTTVRLHVVHDPERNARIVEAARQQRTVHNLTVAHLLEHRSDEPVQKSATRGVTGLQGHWVEWRRAREDLAQIPSKVARGAIAAAADRVAKWEDTNRRHAAAVVNAIEKDKAIPRATQKRMPRPERLYRRRKADERNGRHRVRIDEGVTRRGRRTLYVPGVGELQTREPIPEGLDIRSCVLVERTPAARVKRKPDERERTFRIHVGARAPKPALKAPGEPGSCVGIDHGVVQAMTCVDDQGKVKTFQHNAEAAKKARAAGPEGAAANEQLPARQPAVETAQGARAPHRGEAVPPAAPQPGHVGPGTRPGVRHRLRREARRGEHDAVGARDRRRARTAGASQDGIEPPAHRDRPRGADRAA